jgi:hypothetical protein
MRWLSGLLSSIFLKRKSKEDNSNVILQPKQWCSILFLLSYVMIALLVFSIFAPGNVFTSNDDRISLIIFSIGTWVFDMILCYYLLTWRIEVFDSYFIFRTMFKKKKISYDNIEIRKSNSGYRFYDDNKYLVGTSFLQDNYRLLDKVIREYQKDNKIRISKKITNVLKPVSGLWFLPFASLIIISIPTISIFLEDGMTFNFYISLSFHLITMYLFLYMSNWTISFKKGELTKRSIFGFKRSYDLNDVRYKITQFFGNPNDTMLYYKDKRIALILGNTNNLCELQSVLKPLDENRKEIK